MARRSDHTPEELKALAIQAGVEIIKERGLSGFSSRSVARRIGYTVGTLYHLFGSLEEFILHINADTLDVWYQELCKALKRNRRDSIQTLAKAYINFCRTNPNRWAALYEHHLPPGRKIPDWYAAKMDRLFALVEDASISYTNRDRRKAKRAAKILWAGIHGLCVLSLSGKLDVVKSESAEVLAKDFINKFLAGFKNSK